MESGSCGCPPAYEKERPWFGDLKGSVADEQQSGWRRRVPTSFSRKTGANKIAKQRGKRVEERGVAVSGCSRTGTVGVESSCQRRQAAILSDAGASLEDASSGILVLEGTLVRKRGDLRSRGQW